MNKFTSLLAVTLLLASSSAWSRAGSAADLTYCLDLKSNAEIAKCAGEISPGGKGKPFPKEKVEDILSQEKTVAPANEPPVKPPASSDTPNKDGAPTN